jgi:hypothetical protein
LARPKKKVVINTSSEQIQELSKEEVWNVLSFAQNLVSGVYPGFVTPDLLSARMRDISFMPKDSTEDDLTAALKDPKNHEAELRSYLEMFEIVHMGLKRILSYMSDLPAFDLTYTTKKKSGEELEEKDYKSPAYKKDIKNIYSFLDKFDYKQSFRTICKQILRNEIFVGCFRDTGDGVVIQELPIDRCKITGRWGRGGFLVDFDMLWFWQPGVDISLYPKFFSDAFNRMFRNPDGSMIKYNPSLAPQDRGSSSYLYWVSLPPEIGWVFKLDMSLVTSTPYFSGLMKDLIQTDLMRALQKNTNMASAAKLLVGQVPLLKESKSNVADMIAIKPDTLGKFLQLVKAGLSSSVSVAAAPLEDMQMIEFKDNNEMYDAWQRTVVANSGMNSALFYSSKLKANAIESQLSFQSDSKILEGLYSQFNFFMDYFANKQTTKHYFFFEFEGNQFYLDRKQRYDYATGLLNFGICLPQKISASLGMKPQQLERQMMEAKAMGFVDSLTPITPAAQMPGSAGAKGSGRPQKDDSELGDAGSQSRDTGSNIEKGGSI